MAEIEEQLAVWDSEWDWSGRGDEWSAWWGGTTAMWRAAIFPRIHAFLPAGTVLEIAPGFGRWTQFLKDACGHLVVVDLAQRCIDHCRDRFASTTNITYHVNDGRSLPMVPDRSIDFAFSFDSLVHAEIDVLEAYLGELARTLAPDGIGFIHHSNLGAYLHLARVTRFTPSRLRGPLIRHGALIDLGAWRAESVTAARFALACERAGLACIGQELISWERGWQLTDAISLCTPRGSRWERGNRVTRNRSFRKQARTIASQYSCHSFASVTPSGGASNRVGDG